MASQRTTILGLSFFYHDAAAALIIDGKVAAAAQEERFTRKKHDESFPTKAVKFCLAKNNLPLADVDYVVFYEKPILKFERLLQTYIKTWPRGWRSFIAAMQSFLKDKLWVEQRIRKALGGYQGRILFTEHHYAHAASAYYCSDFDESLVITMDGVREWDTTTIGYGVGNKLQLSKTIHFPHSLGMLYSALTYYLGFKVNSAEYKVMGLAPYGNPETYREQLAQLLDLKNDGSFALNMEYFSYEYSFTMTNKRFDELFGGPRRSPESPLTQREKDIAAALQALTEKIVLRIVAYAQTLYPSRRLCLAGGVALNCVANGKIMQSGLIEDIYVQPAAGDAGGSVGAALYVYYDMLKNHKQKRVMPNAYLGTSYDDEAIATFLNEDIKELVPSGEPIVYAKIADDLLPGRVAALLPGNNVIGWFQGPMEFGPRALGSRSIIADPRHQENWQRVNLKIKFRESFRPFAPAVLAEKATEYFDLKIPSPYMLLVAPVKRSDIPAVTHVDSSARVQTVERRDHPRYYDLINEFYRLTGCPVIINTSFNVRGEPIVESPRDAFNCFLNTEMDYLVLGNYIISKAENPFLARFSRKEQYLKNFALD